MVNNSANRSEDAGVTLKRPRISLTMIVRDEAENLSGCLKSIDGLVDEIVVVDTGSTDNTRAIAERFGARVFEFPWQESFAAARNESLRYATSEWIFWMDADERLDAENRLKLQALFHVLRNDEAAYMMRCVGTLNGATVSGVVDHLRLFPNRPEFRWEYRVHEQILPAIRRAKMRVRHVNIDITHRGYTEPAARERKLRRNLRLLECDHADHPDDPFILFNLGGTRRDLGHPKEAIRDLQQCVDCCRPRKTFVRMAYAWLADCQARVGDLTAALKTCTDGQREYPDDAELLFTEALLRRRVKDLAAAEGCLRRLLASGRVARYATGQDGLLEHRARHNLAIICREAGKLEEAETEWLRLVAARPGSLNARIGLGEVFLDRGKWTALEDHAKVLEELGAEGEVAAALLRGEAMIRRGEHGTAYQLLSSVAERFPNVLKLQVLLSRTALQAGLGPEAERALLGVLKVEPNHTEAKHNLSELRSRRRQSP